MLSPSQIIDIMATRHPGKNIVRLPEDHPTEIICEIEPTSEHPEYNVAIAAIRSSEAHYHKKATEIYEVIDGELNMSIDGQVRLLKKGDSYTIKPSQVHSATGNFTIARVTSRPGWTQKDHILKTR